MRFQAGRVLGLHLVGLKILAKTVRISMNGTYGGDVRLYRDYVRNLT